MHRLTGAHLRAEEAHPSPVEWLAPGMLPSRRAHALTSQLRASWEHSHQAGWCQTGDGRPWRAGLCVEPGRILKDVALTWAVLERLGLTALCGRERPSQGPGPWRRAGLGAHRQRDAVLSYYCEDTTDGKKHCTGLKCISACALKPYCQISPTI